MPRELVAMRADTRVFDIYGGQTCPKGQTPTWDTAKQSAAKTSHFSANHLTTIHILPTQTPLTKVLQFTVQPAYHPGNPSNKATTGGPGPAGAVAQVANAHRAPPPALNIQHTHDQKSRHNGSTSADPGARSTNRAGAATDPDLRKKFYGLQA
ncbi:unnamed protein product [Pleuronectes platessa]|uniref:Uncharacterized protein n=1 Tax=Pleuronectes platessa TaxID=8262 RepID=A0A9N7W3W5_PLEPL|nr:unnamed protein product [Pleuronectes platessa]